MLMGEYSHTIDAKGRVSLPADFRAALGDSFVITKGLDNCLFVYSHDEWRRISEKINAMSLLRSDARKINRFIFSGAREAECDKQGRFLIPANLRAYASLEKDAVLIGVSNRVELWAKAAWENYNEQIAPEMAEIAEALADLGI